MKQKPKLQQHTAQLRADAKMSEGAAEKSLKLCVRGYRSYIS
jgi:hypothetical protein